MLSIQSGQTAPVPVSGALPCLSDSRPRLVALGGGTGLPLVLRGLSDELRQASCGRPTAGPSDELTAIVCMTDDGGSSGRLRRELGMLPPGDIRNCLAAMADRSSGLHALIQHRFQAGHALTGHPVGNLLLVALTQMTGDFTAAVEQLSALLATHGRVLPSTCDRVALRAELEGGGLVEGERAIVARRARIRRLSLACHARPLPEVVRALVNADAIVVGPGSLYTSLLPNLLVGGVAPTISGVRAVRIYVANLMTEPGETDGYTLADHVRVIREHVGRDLFDYVLVNSHPIDPIVAARYAELGSVEVPGEGPAGLAGPAVIVRRDIADSSGGKVRHASAPLARAILELVRQGRPGGGRAGLESAAGERARLPLGIGIAGSPAGEMKVSVMGSL